MDDAHGVITAVQETPANVADGSQLPVLSSIDGIPVLDLRYLVADYRKKTSKIDEQGSRRTLASATAAASEMLSRFDFESDDESDLEA